MVKQLLFKPSDSFRRRKVMRMLEADTSNNSETAGNFDVWGTVPRIASVDTRRDHLSELFIRPSSKIVHCDQPQAWNVLRLVSCGMKKITFLPLRRLKAVLRTYSKYKNSFDDRSM